ncbi:MAG: DUF6285 domain-containing protein [Pseudomonadota bacterium]
MHNQPSVAELIEAVKHFIDESAAPQLKGHAAFHARVASNALATALRELNQRPEAEAKERERLQDLLPEAPPIADASTLNRLLCEAIQDGRFTPSSPGLLAHLKATTIAQVEIDQPRYSGLRAAKQP